MDAVSLEALMTRDGSPSTARRPRVRSLGPRLRWPCGTGLACGVLAYHVYGLADCIALGARAGVFLWAILGLMAALANLEQTKC